MHAVFPTKTVLFVLVWIAEEASGCASGGAGASASTDGTGGGSAAGLKGILGGDISASAYSEDSASGARVKSDADLFCDDADGCRWRNAQDDRLDWATVSGRPDSTRWKFATGTAETFSPNAFVLASNPRAAEDSGDLVSARIGCQNGDGEMQFKHWISRTRTPETRATLDACWRFVGEITLRDCLRVVEPSPGPSYLRLVGPIDGDFELVIRGQNFVAEPEGGFIVVDDIQYIAPVIDSKGCPLDLTTAPPLTDFPPFTDEPPPPTTRPPTNPNANLRASCLAVTCPISLDREFCGYNPLGNGAVGPGLNRGWEITTGEQNIRANALTGVRFDKNKLRTEPFGIADFPDPRKVELNANTKYVLETGDRVDFTKDVYVKFDRYLATQGVQLSLCRDANANDCVYDSPPLGRGRGAANNRRWIEELIRLPAGPPGNLFFIAQYDSTRQYNAGQVGLSNIQVYDSPSGTGRPVC